MTTRFLVNSRKAENEFLPTSKRWFVSLVQVVRVTIIARTGAEVASLARNTPEAGHTAVSRSASAITVQQQDTTTALATMASQHIKINNRGKPRILNVMT